MHPPFGPPVLFHFLSRLALMAFFFGGAFLLLRFYLKQTRKPLPGVSEDKSNNVILPLRLQACERLVLFLERIHPSNLLLRINDPAMTVSQMQSALVRTIREEFEYNLSQQLYISGNAWELIKNAKEETIAMVNQAASGLAEDAPGAELVKKILDLAVARGKLPVENALDEIKRELQRLFTTMGT